MQRAEQRRLSEKSEVYQGDLENHKIVEINIFWAPVLLSNIL